MRIEFKSIHIENFLSIGNADIDLGNNGYVLVTGTNNNTGDGAKSNGSGKSSIWDAIVWALTGSTIRGTKDVVNIHGNDGAYVSIKFNIDGKPYEVTRTKDHSKFKTNLKVIENGNDVSGKGIRDSEKILATLLPDLNSSLIGSVIILGQGLPQRFSNNTPSGRKEVLEKLSKSDFMIGDLKDRISRRKKEIEVKLRDVSDNLIKLNTTKEIAESDLATCKQKLSNMQPVDTIKSAIEIVEDSITADKNKLNKITEEFNFTSNCVQELRDKYSALTSEKSKALLETDMGKSEELRKVESEYSEKSNKISCLLSSYNSDISNKQTELNRLNSITDICPTCGQKLVGVVKPDTSGLERELTKLRERYMIESENSNSLFRELNSIRSDIDNKYGRIKSEISARYDNSIAEVTNQGRVGKSNLDNLSTTISQLNTLIEEKTKKLNEYNNYLLIHNKDTEDLNKKIEDYEKQLIELSEKIMYKENDRDNTQKHLDVISKFNSVITRDFRGYLLSNVIDYIDSKSKEYSNIVFGTDKIRFELNGNDIDIIYSDKSYDNLSGGEKQKVDLIIQFAIRDMLCKFLNFSSNILVVDEIFDNLDSIGCSRVLDLIAEKLNDIDSIYIITHHTDIEIPCDSIISVTKDEQGISSVNVV